MQLRRIVPAAALVVALAGCEPSIEQSSPSSPTVTYAVLDPATSQIPLPNDLALQTAPTGAPKNATDELLQMFVSQGGFPNDQEVPITVDLQQWTTGTATPVKSPPAAALDTSTLTKDTLLVLEQVPGNPIPTELTLGTDYKVFYAAGKDRGTITIRREPIGPWNPGSRYVVVLRGGASGAKLAGGGQIIAMPTMYLLTRGQPLTNPEYVKLIPGNSPEEQAALALQLEHVRQSYAPIFALVQTPRNGPDCAQDFQKVPPVVCGYGWGATAAYDIASMQTFQVAPATVPGPHVVIDANAGIVPLPSDFLLDPATGGKTVVKNPAFGALATGIATLDGFSTTAMLLAQTSAPVVMSTVNKDSVFVYDLSDPSHPVRLKEVTEALGAGDIKGAGFVAEPYLIGKTATQAACPGPTNANCFSTAIGLQPAFLVPTPAGSGLPPFVTVPPLKEKTEYAVIITNGVLAATAPAPTPLASPTTTLARILLFDNALVDATGKSLLPGTDDVTAGGLEKMRQGIAAARGALQAEKPTLTKANVAAAYTVRTQTVTDVSVQLAAAPYQNAASFVPGNPTQIPLAAVQAQAPGLDFSAVQEFLSVPVPTLNPIDPSTGALNPDPTKWSPMLMTAYVIVPKIGGTAQVTCNFSSTLKCAPLVVFQHGLGRTKADVFAIANTLAQAGFVVAAIDSPLHGERAYCMADTDCSCAGVAGSCTPKCTFLTPKGVQGDAFEIGRCNAPSTASPSVSGKLFVSPNFFRTRDANRGTVLDVSALILALAPPSTPSNGFAAELAANGLFVDATRVHWVGQSLGGMYGTINVASNPRLGRAVLNVPGATFIDIFTGSPSFAPAVLQLLSSLNPPIAPGTPEYLQFVNVAKWVFDPGDPINYARHLLGDASHPTLSNLLQDPTGKTPQPPKQIFGQYAICDQTIPNQFNLFLLDQIGLGATSASSTTGNGYTAYTVTAASPPACSGATGKEHGFLLDWATNPTATLNGQLDASAYLLDQTLPKTATR